jgi:hypothetical protein
MGGTQSFKSKLLFLRHCCVILQGQLGDGSMGFEGGVGSESLGGGSKRLPRGFISKAIGGRGASSGVLGG